MIIKCVSCFRTWMSKTDIKHKIIVFDPKILAGKVSNDLQKGEAVKPVLMHFLFILHQHYILL